MRDHIKWDETNLTEIERNKPVRQKITEPKTPFHPKIEDDGGSLSPLKTINSFDDFSVETISPEAIRSALNDVASSSNSSSSGQNIVQKSVGWNSSDDDEVEADQSMEAEKSGISFKEHRRAHYDEFRKVKELGGKEGSMVEEDGSDF
ncbi:protein phosphatase inhibitor 2-like [Impatiens glandulifera]|uniref:protein phosphatase inhibitor 2-like n=1 Tax=Impatiens glandulifera TaxID=253017 RepID=UPI001FB12A92|nr:protein phosphatase inhibitor 2-like [Impatiens glandulifera]